jgi:pilus assembly protein Flp/PilA
LSLRSEKGQGLVEYALILVLVAIVVMAVLLVLGPSIGQIFTRVTDELHHPGGPLISASVARTGNGNGNDVVVTVTVSESTTVTATDSQSGGSVSFSCSDTCDRTLTGVGHDAGTITLSADGDSLRAGYAAQN